MCKAEGDNIQLKGTLISIEKVKGKTIGPGSMDYLKIVRV
jgi:hypothetical protein